MAWLYKNWRRIAGLCCMAAGAVAVLLTGGCGADSEKNTALLEQSYDSGVQGKWQQSEDSAMDVLKNNPDDLNALMLRAIASWHLKKRDVALASARQAAEIAPESYQAQYLYGWMLAQRNDSAKNAIQVLRKALELRPNDRNTLLLLLQCCQRINSDDTLIYLRKLPEADRSKPEIQTIRAIYYLDRRDNRTANIRQAQDSLVKAYKYNKTSRDPKLRGENTPDVVLNMALFFDHYKRDRKQALSLYRHYLKITHGNPELNPTRAQVQSRIGKLQSRNNR